MLLTRREAVQTASLAAVLASVLKASVGRLFGKLSDRLAFPGGVPMPAQSLGVVACAVRRELIALSHTDTWLLVLSAAIGALAVVACIAWPQVSRIYLKTHP